MMLIYLFDSQVSTWFANARRRLKKENKMTWSPRNRSEDGSDDVDNNEDEDDCGAGGEGSRRRDVMSPTHDLDMNSSKPSSPLLSPGKFIREFQKCRKVVILMFIKCLKHTFLLKGKRKKKEIYK